MQKSISEPQQCIAEGDELVSDLTLAPMEGRRIVVGAYENCLPQPQVSLTCSPVRNGEIIARLERIEGKDEYLLVYLLQNFSDTTFHIKITQKYV